METQTIRLGGMALANGVLVHGPSAWGCAVRHADGTITTASGAKPRFAPGLTAPFLRGPVRMAEALALLPVIRRAVPEARLPFERPRVVATVVGVSVLAGAVRRSGLSPALRETVVAVASVAPALVSLRGGEVTSYHGAEHVSIGSYERGGEPAPKEHERCGSHLIGPLLVTTALANTAAARLPSRLRRTGRGVAAVAALGASVELLGWMARNPERPLARALGWPGHALQERLSTTEPSAEQLEVAENALRACLALEQVTA